MRIIACIIVCELLSQSSAIASTASATATIPVVKFLWTAPHPHLCLGCVHLPARGR